MTETPEKPKSVQVVDYIDAEKLAKDMGFSLTDLSSAMMEQASLFTYYGTIAAKASRQVDNLKMLLEICEAKIYRLRRDEMVKAGEKTTEALMEKIVQTDTRVVAFRRALNEAKQIESNAKTAVEGFRHRRDMLIQQGLISREELKGELRIGVRREAEQSQEDLKQRVIDRLTAAP